MNLLLNCEGAMIKDPRRWVSCGSGGQGALLSGHERDLTTFSSLHESLPLTSVSLVSSGQHTVLLDADAEEVTFYVAGENTHGQLGFSSPDATLVIPASIKYSLSVAKVALGWEHSVILTSQGEVLVAGRRTGSVNDNTSGDGASVPSGWTRAEGLPPCRDVACGRQHTLVLAGDKERVFSWGSTRHGLQPGTTDIRNTCTTQPQALATLDSLLKQPTQGIGEATPLRQRDFIAVACGWQHSAVLCSDGSVITWGSNRHGQCGTEPGRSHPHGVVNAPGFVAGLGPHSPYQARHLHSGWSHMAAIAEPSVRGETEEATRDVGASDFGDTYDDKIAGAFDAAPLVAAPCAASDSSERLDRSPPSATLRHHSVILTWGRADLGQLGRRVASGHDHREESVSLPHWHPAPVRLAEFTGGSGCVHAGSLPVPRTVACGAEHVLCAAVCGCGFSWGWNEHGNLGLGDTVNRALPARIGCCSDGRRITSVAAGGAVSFVEFER